MYLTDSSVDMPRAVFGEVKEMKRAEFESAATRVDKAWLARPCPASNYRWPPDQPHMLRDHK